MRRGLLTFMFSLIVVAGCQNYTDGEVPTSYKKPMVALQMDFSEYYELVNEYKSGTDSFEFFNRMNKLPYLNESKVLLVERKGGSFDVFGFAFDRPLTGKEISDISAISKEFQNGGKKK